MTLARRGLLALALTASAAAAQAAGNEVFVPPADYPAGVVPGEAQKVVVAFISGPDGRTKSCRVVHKSKDKRLDEATCRLVTERARFAPGPEQRISFTWGPPDPDSRYPREAGAPLIIHRDGWMTEQDYPHAALDHGQTGELWYRVWVSPTGRPLSCVTVESSGSKALDEGTCKIVLERSVFIPASDGHGGVRAGAGIYKVKWDISG